MRIDAGRDDLGGEFFAVLKGNTTGAAILCENFDDRRFGADFNAGFARSVGDGV